MPRKKATKKKTKPRKKRTIQSSANARSACISRRASKSGITKKSGVRRCNSLFLANCLTGKGTVSKTKHCRAIARTKLSKSRARGNWAS